MRVRGALLLAATVAGLGMIVGTAGAKPLYGVVPQDGALPDAADLDLMPAAGIGGIRLMLHWGTVESVQGTYDWSTPDAMVREAARRGVQPHFFLYGTPEWAARQDGRSCSGNQCAIFPPVTDPTRAAFAAFAAAAVGRYGPGGDFWEVPAGQPPAVPPAGGSGSPSLCEVLDPACCVLVPTGCPDPPPPPPPSPPPPPGEPPCDCDTATPLRVWQVWNEQNSVKYFAPKVSVKRYAELLRTTGAAIKAADPGADVMLGGMWGPASAKDVVKPVKSYLEALYRIGGIESSFDSIAVHPYSAGTRTSIAQVALARRVARRAGDRRVGTWISELGWASGGPRRNPYVKGLKGQARLLKRALAEYERRARSFRLRGVFWYSWRDKAGGSGICEWCGHAGLRAKDGSAKPAWKAFARVARS